MQNMYDDGSWQKVTESLGHGSGVPIHPDRPGRGDVGRLPRDPFGMRPAPFARWLMHVLTFFGDLVARS